MVVTMDVLFYRHNDAIIEHASARGCQRVINTQLWFVDSYHLTTKKPLTVVDLH